MSVDFPAFGYPTSPTSAILQMQAQILFFAWQTRLRFSRRAIRRRRKMRVAMTAEPTFRDQHAVPVGREVGTCTNSSPGVRTRRCRRALRARCRFLVCRCGWSLRRCATARFEALLKAEVEKRVEVGIRYQVDGTARAAVAAVGPATRHELLAAEAMAPRPP